MVAAVQQAAGLAAVLQAAEAPGCHLCGCQQQLRRRQRPQQLVS